LNRNNASTSKEKNAQRTANPSWRVMGRLVSGSFEKRKGGRKRTLKPMRMII